MKNNGIDNEYEEMLKKAAIALAENDSLLFEELKKDETIINPNQEELDKRIYAMLDEYFGKD